MKFFNYLSYLSIASGSVKMERLQNDF